MSHGLMQVLVILFAPQHSSPNATVGITLSGLASPDSVSVWGSSNVTNGTGWLAPPSSTQIRVLADYSMHSAQPDNFKLQPLQPQRLAFNLTKHYEPANIRPVSFHPLFHPILHFLFSSQISSAQASRELANYEALPLAEQVLSALPTLLLSLQHVPKVPCPLLPSEKENQMGSVAGTHLVNVCRFGSWMCQF